MSKDKCCRCGVGVDQGRAWCDKCAESKAAERWAKLPKAEWDEGAGPIYSDAYDEYFWFQDLAYDFAHEHEIKDWDDMRLVICKPQYATPLSSDHWEDELPNDGEDVPDWLEEAVAEFNEKLKGQAPLSYEPCGKYAVDTSDWELPKEDDDA